MAIKLSKSGGGWPINTIRPVNDNRDLREVDGQVWIKTGVVDTDVSLYPNAVQNSGQTEVVINNAGTTIKSFAANSNTFYTIQDGGSTTNGKIYRIDPETGQNTSTFNHVERFLHAVGASDTTVYVFDGGYDRIYKYSTSGTYTGAFYLYESDGSRTNSVYSMSVEENNNYMWVIIGSNELLRVNASNGSTISRTQNFSRGSIAVVKDSIFHIPYNSTTLTKYNRNTLQPENTYTLPSAPAPYGNHEFKTILRYKNALWACYVNPSVTSRAIVYRVPTDGFVGIPDPILLENSTPYYVRVK